MSADKTLANIMLDELKTQAIGLKNRDHSLSILDGSNIKAVSVDGVIDLESLALCVLKLIKLDLPEEKEDEFYVVKYHQDMISQFYYVKWSDGKWTKLNPLIDDERRLISNLEALEKRGFFTEKIGTEMGRER